MQEIQCLEKRTIIAHVLGLRPTHTDLRLLLLVALKQDIDKITDVQILNKNHDQLEFELERVCKALGTEACRHNRLNRLTTQNRMKV